MPELRPGSTLGPYEIQKILGHGGMATVYQARQPSLDRLVALKVLSTDLARDPQFVQRFQREARTAASMEHTNVVQIYDVGQADGAYFIAMRYVAGLTLAQLLERDGRLPLDRATRLLSQIAAALDYAHHQPAPVIHRDLKPGNVLVESGDRATLVDFGIAQAVGATRLTQLHSIVGTPEYMAPEQIEGGEIAPATDLYALGIIAYELLAGREPFRSEAPTGVMYQQVHAPMPPLRAQRPDLPNYVEAAIRRMLSKKPHDRFQSGDEFMRALVGQQVATRRAAPASLPWPALAAAAAALLVIGGVALSSLTLGGSAAAPGAPSLTPAGASQPATPPPTTAPALVVASVPTTDAAAVSSVDNECRTALANVDAVWSSNIGAAAVLLEQARAADPNCADGSGTVTDKLYAAYVGLGQQYVDRDQSDLAVAQFDKAINLVPSRPEAPAGRRIAAAYHDGMVARGQSDLDRAADRLSDVVRTERDYANGRAISALVDVYMARAGNRSSAGQLQDAQADVDQVLALQPGNESALGFRAQLQRSLAPPTVAPVLAAPVLAPPPPPSNVTSVSVGASAGGRPMTAVRIGAGAIRLGITGDLHGGKEAAAYSFLTWLVQSLQNDPGQVPPQLSVYVLPTANPDDVSRSTGFNSNGVDINRNFAANWQAQTCGAPGGRYGPTGCKSNGGGSSPFSEPESQAVRSLVQGQQLGALLIVNSGVSVISSRNGGGGLGEPLAQLLARQTGVPYVPTYTAYPVTGQLVDWVESLGKIGIEVNMPASFSNDRGLQVVQTVFQYVGQ